MENVARASARRVSRSFSRGETFVASPAVFVLSSYTKRAFAGASSDQDGMMCRHTDSDSGLGRSTPPRRAASPGIGSMRHLTSPSGPGSLPPALMTSKKRVYDDGSSDISSTPSSMMDYNGECDTAARALIPSMISILG